MKRAKPENRKILAAPKKTEYLGYSATFTAIEAEKIKAGFMPQDMDDKWFIYFSENRLYFHRSWSGILVYALTFKTQATGIEVIDSWVNRDPKQYNQQDINHDRRLVDFLIRAFLLR